MPILYLFNKEDFESKKNSLLGGKDAACQKKAFSSDVIKQSRLIFVETKKGDEESEETATEESAEKKPAPEKMPEELKGAETIGAGRIPAIRTEIGRQVNTALGQIAAAAALERPKNAELIKRLEALRNDIKELNRLDADLAQKTKAKLAELVQNGTITEEQANKFFDLDPEDSDFEAQWAGVSALPTEENETLLKLKREEAGQVKKLDEDFAKKMSEIREVMNRMNTEVLTKAHQQHALRELQRQVGFPLTKGQKLSYVHLEEILDRQGELKDYSRTKKILTIEGVTFEEVEITGEDGIKKKIPAITPTIIVSWVENGQKVTKKLDGGVFKQLVDLHDICQIIETKSELTQAIGTEINEGETIEYRETHLAITGEPTGREKSVKIEKIDEENRTVTLSNEVVTAVYPSIREQKVLSFGEFAKWYIKNLVEKPITSIEDLRAKLAKLNEERNAYYKEPDGTPRSSEQYPPIEVTPGEVLMFGAIPASVFVIENVTDDEIELDNGSKYKYSSFYRWVKENEVEKKTPETEAHKTTALITDPQEREAAFQEEMEKASRELEDRKRKGQEPPEDFVYANDEEGATPSASYLKKLWAETYFMRPDDLWEMGKIFVDYWKRRYGRKQKTRIGTLGENAFPGLYGSEYKRVKQASENEHVNNFKESYSNFGVDELKNKMYATKDKDELKAVIEVLAEKGQIKWEDKKMWETFNRIAQGSPCWVREKTYLDDIEKIVDSFWGRDSFREYRNKNDSSYNSVREAFQDNAKRLENDPQKNGGLRGALKSLMFKHLRGDYVNPAEYESYLYFAIKAGKLSFENKLYFLIMGLGAVGPSGMPLLSIDRVASVEGDLLNNFPILDYFVDPNTQKYDEQGRPKRNRTTGEPEKGRPDMNFYKRLVRLYCAPNGDLRNIHKADECENGTEFDDFSDRVIMWNEYARIRLEDKAASEVARWDHDDFHKFAPILNDETIEQLTKLRGGAQAQASIAGLRNAYTGLNDATNNCIKYMLDAINRGDQDEAEQWLHRTVKVMRSFIRMDAILDRRFHHSEPGRTRFSSSNYRGFSNTDSKKTVNTHVNEMRLFIGALCGELGLGDEWRTISTKYTSEQRDSRTGRKGWAIQEEIIPGFGENLERSISGTIKNEAGQVDMRKVAALFSRVQAVSPVTGIQQKIKVKVDTSKMSREAYELVSPERKDVADMVKQIKDMREGKGETKAGRKARQQARLEEVIRLADQNKFGQITASDVKLLEAELMRLEGSEPVKEKEETRTTTIEEEE
jgi:hypothetical protein